MAALTYFTVTGTYLAALKDSPYDVDSDPDLTPMSGTVTLTPLVDTGDSIPATTLTPAANLWLAPVKASIKSGVVTCNGVAGVKLVANTAVLGLVGNLFYRVEFTDGLVAGGKTFFPDPFNFQAPTTAVTMDLVEVTPATGQPATGPVPSSAVLSVAGRTGNIVFTAADISNSSTVGRAVLTAADGAAACAAIGAAATADITTAVNALVAGAPGALNTLKELADALNDDASFAATITTALAGKQPSDADLTAIAALTSAANKVPYATGAGAWALADFTSAGRALVDDADAAAQRATLSAAKRIAYLVDDYGTVDYTGATSSATAIAAAKTAMGTNKGVLVFGPGIVDSGTAGLGTFQQGQGVIGAGKDATRIKYTGTGDCIRARDTRAWVDYFGPLNDTAGAGMGGPFVGFTIDGTGAGTNSCAMHVGDLNGVVMDVFIVNFTNTGAKGLWLDNRTTWMEEANVRASVKNCTQCIVFDCNGGFPSFDYGTFWLMVWPRANQDGCVFKGSIELAGCDVTIVGASDIHGSATNSGTMVSIGAAGGDTSNLNGCDILVAMEMSQVATGQPYEAHVPLLIGANASIFDSRGSIRYFKRSGGNIQWKASSTGSGARIANFFGVVEGCSDVSAGMIAKFGSLQDSNGATILDLAATASAVNFLGIGNHTTGNSPYMYAAGANTNIGMAFKPKGSGTFTLWDGNFNTVLTTLAGVASAVNYLYAGNAATGNKPSFGAAGSDTNVGLDLQTQGTGRVTNNGVNVPTVSSTDTETNKRITPRIGTVASSATPTINTDNVDQFNITALAAAITSFTTNLSGTPTDGQCLDIRIKGDATPRAITWGASFTGTLLTTTAASKTHLQRLKWDAAAAKWAGYSADSGGY